MRALVITQSGPPDVLSVEERPDPEPGAGEVRVAVRAAGLNFADLLARVGLYADAPKPPCIVGYEFAGDVDRVGAGVDGVAPGDRVIGWARFGSQAELVVTAARNVMPLPAGWTYAQGAALPVVYGTAYAALVRYGALHPGESVLIQAAAGGVGIAATQIARAAGAGTIYGTASERKHDALRGFGVDHPIDYTRGRFDREVRRLAGDEQPLDIVLDAIGGASLRRGWSLLRPGGRLVTYGASSVLGGDRRSVPRAVSMLAQTPVFHPLRMASQSKAVIGLNMLRVWDSKGSLDEFVEPLGRWIEDGAVRPVVAEEFPFDRAADAHRFMQERRNVGKVVLTP